MNKFLVILVSSAVTIFAQAEPVHCRVAKIQLKLSIGTCEELNPQKTYKIQLCSLGLGSIEDSEGSEQRIHFDQQSQNWEARRQRLNLRESVVVQDNFQITNDLSKFTKSKTTATFSKKIVESTLCEGEVSVLEYAE